MLLLTYSFEEQQNFNLLQAFFKNTFANNYQQKCSDFYVGGRKPTEISFAFIENEIRIFYSMPKCDDFDTIVLSQTCNIKELMAYVYEEFFIGDITIKAYISYENLKCPKKYLFLYLPEECKNDDNEIAKLFNNENFNPSCFLYTSPHIAKEIQLIIHTFDDFYASIYNTIDGSNKDDFIPRFFSLVSLLLYGR